jgi:hypothetical protein
MHATRAGAKVFDGSHHAAAGRDAVHAHVRARCVPIRGAGRHAERAIAALHNNVIRGVVGQRHEILSDIKAAPDAAVVTPLQRGADLHGPARVDGRPAERVEVLVDQSLGVGLTLQHLHDVVSLRRVGHQLRVAAAVETVVEVVELRIGDGGIKEEALVRAVYAVAVAGKECAVA